MVTNNSCNYSPTQYAVQVGNSNGALTSLSAGVSNSALQGVTGADPSFTTIPEIVGLGISSASTGTGLTFDGSNTLANYALGTWIPTLSFAGASVGITYSTQIGNYTQIGNIVYYYFNVVLTNKGSSTGEARISLPINLSSIIPPTFPLTLNNVTFVLPMVEVHPFPSAQYARFVQSSNTGSGNSSLSNTAIANNSSFIATGFYYV